MELLDHDTEGATIHLDSRELLMVMALVQEGREAFECEGATGAALDQLFCSAVASVLAAQCNAEFMLTASNDEEPAESLRHSKLQ